MVRAVSFTKRIVSAVALVGVLTGAATFAVADGGIVGGQGPVFPASSPLPARYVVDTSMLVSSSGTVTSANGGFYLPAPSLNGLASVSVLKIATATIAGPFSATGSATIATPLSLWIQSGATELDGNLSVAGGIQLAGFAGLGPSFLTVDNAGNVGQYTGPGAATISYGITLGAMIGDPGWCAVSSTVPDPAGSASAPIEYAPLVVANFAQLSVVVASNALVGTGTLRVNITRNGTAVANVGITSSTSSGSVLGTGSLTVSGGSTSDTWGVKLTLPLGTFTSGQAFIQPSIRVW
jgi:hypothetical protein